MNALRQKEQAVVKQGAQKAGIGSGPGCFGPGPGLRGNLSIGRALRLALLNIGEEELTGHESIREAARMIRTSNLPFDFRGYIEADKIGSADIDVIVTDGFTGNIAIKTAEGIARMISDMLKDAFKSGPIAMLGAALAMPALKQFRSKMDPRKVNGGVFIGLNGVVVKSHGGTDAVGFAQAIKVAAGMGESSFRAEVEENLRRLAPAQPPPSPAEQAVQ